MPSAEQGRRLYTPFPAECKLRVTFVEDTATPEGHVVHRLAGAFRQHLAGQTLAASSPQGRFAEGAALLDGLRLERAEAWGKQMALRFEGGVWLRVHLGLYGMWRFAGPGLERYGRRNRGPVPDEGLPPPQGAVRLRLRGPRHVADLSGPTACELLDQPGLDAVVAGMGADPLRRDADPERAWRAIHASRSPLAVLLMRQDVIAGIGNIYRAELLFRARLPPLLPGRELTRAAWEALWADTVLLLAEGVQAGRIITTLPGDRERKTGVARPADASYVAHRAGKPCRVCGAPVRAAALAGRTLYWCAVCQAG